MINALGAWLLTFLVVIEYLDFKFKGKISDENFKPSIAFALLCALAVFLIVL